MKQCYSPSSDDAARNPRSRIRNLALALLIALFTLPVLAQGGKSVSALMESNSQSKQQRTGKDKT